MNKTKLKREDPEYERFSGRKIVLLTYDNIIRTIGLVLLTVLAFQHKSTLMSYVDVIVEIRDIILEQISVLY